MPSVAELAYIAGLFDGEGSVTIRSSKGLRRPHALLCQITQESNEALLVVHRLFGGSLFDQPRHNSPNPLPEFHWSIYAKSAKEFLVAIRPYLLVKADVADLGLQFQSTVKMGRGLAAGVFEERERLRALVMRTNRRMKD